MIKGSSSLLTNVVDNPKKITRADKRKEVVENNKEPKCLKERLEIQNFQR